MFRISLLLWLIALAALNLTVFRYSEALINISPKLAGLIGLMPLFDFFFVSVYLALTRKFRFGLSRRSVRKSILESIAAVSWAILIVATMSCLLLIEVVPVPIDTLSAPYYRWTIATD